jgi:hypothetical protein
MEPILLPARDESRWEGARRAWRGVLPVNAEVGVEVQSEPKLLEKETLTEGAKLRKPLN